MLVTEMYKGQGLGNQLWCYVTTRVIAKDNGYEFGIKSPENFKGCDLFDLDFGSEVIGGSGPEGGPPTTLPEGIYRYYNEQKITHPSSSVDIRICDKNLPNVPDNTKIDGMMQGEEYYIHRRDEIRQWLKVKKKYECNDYSHDDICVIYFRGGEFTTIEDVFLPQKYWDDAVEHMRKINKDFKFVVVTDDDETAKKFFPLFDVLPFGFEKDYAIMSSAKYLILSNSSFGFFPAWLSENLKFCIAPKYWSQYNTSDGFWGCSYNITKGWTYLDRDGILHDYDSCIAEHNEYIENHKDYFEHDKIRDNFLVISNYNNDISWVPEYSDNYVIYDQSEHPAYPKNIDPKKVKQNKHLGHNIYDYCTFIIDNYDNLPERTIFATGNIFPRHVSRECFEKVMNNDFFTPIEDRERHKMYWPTCFFSSDGGYCEINNSWYLAKHPTKYFNNYNDFLKFCFKDPVIPRYIRFAPAANYIVPKENILKLPKVFYQNLKTFVSHFPSAIPGESHLIERALHTLWMCNFEISENMLKPVDENFKNVPQNPFSRPASVVPGDSLKRSEVTGKGVFWSHARMGSLRGLVVQFLKLLNRIKMIGLFKRRRIINEALANRRRKEKIYDIFTFFNELELLEIRLNILDKYVDYFVIVESTQTFSGLPKKLYYQENKHLFKKYTHKIIHHVTDDVPDDEADLRGRLSQSNLNALDRSIAQGALTSDNVPKGEIHWLKEFYQKESIKKALVSLGGDDICFVSDVDEIWNPDVKIDYSKNDIFKLRQKVYSYYFNNRSSESWAGTLVTKYKNIKNNCLNHLRTVTKTRYTYIDNGGWHFTNMGGADNVRLKLESYGHQEFNNEEIKSNIEEKIANNQDFIGRKFKFWADESNLPKYILNNKNKYKKFFK